MDEEDGRLGPRAQKSGHVDVLTDALAMSLCSLLKQFHWVPDLSCVARRSRTRALKDQMNNEVML